MYDIFDKNTKYENIYKIYNIFNYNNNYYFLKKQKVLH